MAAEGLTVILHQSRLPLAHRLIEKAPPGSVMVVTPPRRTLDQNSKLHAMVTDIARARPQGRKHSIRVWKILFMAMVGREVEFEPALDGNGIVPIPASTSRLTKAQCGELIDAIDAYAAEHGIELKDPEA